MSDHKCARCGKWCDCGYRGRRAAAPCYCEECVEVFSIEQATSKEHFEWLEKDLPKHPKGGAECL